MGAVLANSSVRTVAVISQRLCRILNALTYRKSTRIIRAGKTTMSSWIWISPAWLVKAAAHISLFVRSFYTCISFIARMTRAGSIRTWGAIRSIITQAFIPRWCIKCDAGACISAGRGNAGICNIRICRTFQSMAIEAKKENLIWLTQDVFMKPLCVWLHQSPKLHEKKAMVKYVRLIRWTSYPYDVHNFFGNHEGFRP